MYARDDAPLISKAGVLAAAGAAGIVLAGALRFIAPGAPGWPMVGTIWALSAGAVIVLTRVTMPSQLRGPLIMALLATMLFGAARSDIFGMHQVTSAVDTGADQATQAAAAVSSYASGVPTAASGPPGAAGADLALTPGRDGNGDDWARDISRAWASRLGGTKGIRVDGWIAGQGMQNGMQWVVVDWGISRDFESLHCGRTSSTGQDRATMIEAIGQPMAQAVQRTAASGKASCQ